MSNRNRPKYLVLGAGITGLSLAYFLSKLSPSADITVVEAKDCAGGWIQTDFENEFLFERGPHTLRLSNPYQKVCEALFNELNLTTELISPSPSVKKKYLSYDQKLHPISMHPLKLLSAQNFGRISFPVLKGCFKKSIPENDESIFSFCNHFFGSYVTHHWIDPLVMGIYGGDLKKLSISACFPSLKHASKSPTPLLLSLLKSMKKNPSKMISFKRGLSTLTRTLKEKTKAEFFFNQPVKKIELSLKPRVWFSNTQIECDHLFSTLPSYTLYDLLKNEPLKTISYLNEIPYISYKMIHIGYEKKCSIPPGFGFLTPSWDQGQISGAIFDSEIFPDQSRNKQQTRLSVMIHENKTLFHQSDDQIREKVLNELNHLFQLNNKPHFFKVYSLDNAIPQYHIGHLEKIDALRKELSLKNSTFSFLGNAFYGVSVPSCIYSSFQLAKKISENKLKVNFA